jgi:hypothetical protein
MIEGLVALIAIFVDDQVEAAHRVEFLDHAAEVAALVLPPDSDAMVDE